MCERGLRKPIFQWFTWFLESTKCMSVLRKQTKALWSIISRHTECVRGVSENRFFIDFHPQHKIYRRHSSVWVLSENRPQQQKNASGTSSFYSSNLKTASESPVFYNTKRSGASTAPSTIINYNKEIIIFNNNNNLLWFGILIDVLFSAMDYSPLLWGTSFKNYHDWIFPHPETQPYDVRTPHFVELWHER